MAEVPNKTRISRHRRKYFTKDAIGKRQGLVCIVVMDFSMKRQVRQAERKLATVAGPFGCQPSLLQLGQNLRRYLLCWIPVIRGETVEHLFVPNPVFEH